MACYGSLTDMRCLLSCSLFETRPDPFLNNNSSNSLPLTQGWNLDSLKQWLALANVTDPVTYVSDPNTLLSPSLTNFSNYRLIYLPSAYRVDNPGGITNATNDALTVRSQDLINYVNQGGSLICLTQAGLTSPYAFLPNPLIFQPDQFQAVNVSMDMPAFSPTSNAGNLFHSMWHGYFTGPIDWSGIARVLVYQQDACPVASGINQNCNATMIANIHSVLTSHVCDAKSTDATSAADPACWRWVNLEIPVLHIFWFVILEPFQGAISGAESVFAR